MASRLDEDAVEQEKEIIEEETIEEDVKGKKKSSEGKTKTSIITWLEGLFKEEGPE